MSVVATLSWILTLLALVYCVVCKIQLHIANNELEQREETTRKLWNKVQRYKKYIRFRGKKDGESAVVTDMKIKRIDRGKKAHGN